MGKEFQLKIPNNEFNCHVAFQPIPVLYRKNAAGKNILGLDDYPHDAIMMQASASVMTSDLRDWARPLIRNLIEEVKAFAGEDRLCPWLYMNYAESDQDVLESYGSRNMERMRDAAAKYDPDGVFAKLCPGGFKLKDTK